MLVTLNQGDQTKIQDLIDSSKQNQYRSLKRKPGYYDKAIFKLLKEDASAIDLIDTEFFVQCFLNGMDDTVFHVLDQHEDAGLKYFANHYLVTQNEDPNPKYRNPLVMYEFKASQQVIIKILNVCHQQISATIDDKNWRGENMLHILIREGYEFATRHVIDNFKDISKICFDTNKSGLSPLMSALSKDSIEEEDLLLKLWNIMINANYGELISVVKQCDKRQNNIFHLCAMFQRNILLSTIAEGIFLYDASYRKELLESLFKPNPDGKVPFHLCRDEKTIILILNRLQKMENEFNIDLLGLFVAIKTKKSNTSLNLFAKKNYNIVIE